MASSDLQVLIVGAGPTGLALACDLARRGVRFRIIDKVPAHFQGSKGKGLQPRTLEVMDDFGVIEHILRNGRFHLPFRGYEGSKVIGERDVHEGRHPTPSTPYASSLITPQWRVEETLRNLLEQSGGHIELGTELVDIAQDEYSVTVTLRHAGAEETVRCGYLVASDGGKSFVRKFLQVSFEGETWKDERMYVADVRLRGLDREAWHSWPKHPDGWLALCPLPSTDLFQLQAQIPPDEEHEPSLEVFREIVRKRTDGMEIELLEAPWMSLYRANVRMVSRYRVGRIFLAGDAAHVHSPAGGQGMNTGIQDAYNLGWKLGSVLHGGPASLLDTYEEERLPVAAGVLGISTKLHRSIVNDVEQNKRRDATTLQLGISYKEASLSVTADDIALKLSAGDRAPDAPGLNADSHPIRLFDLLRGPQFSLLRLFADGDSRLSETFEGIRLIDVQHQQPQHNASSELFVDEFGHFEAAYGGAKGGLILVRPDGYIGWVGSLAKTADLTQYLEGKTGRG